MYIPPELFPSRKTFCLLSNDSVQLLHPVIMAYVSSVVIAKSSWDECSPAPCQMTQSQIA